jgi:hypothetical protein
MRSFLRRMPSEVCARSCQHAAWTLEFSDPAIGTRSMLPAVFCALRTHLCCPDSDRCCPPSPALAAQQLELAQRNSLSLQDPRTTGRPTDSSATQPPPRGLHAESGRLLSVFQLGPAAPQDQRPHPKACHATAEAHTGLRSRPCVGGMQARAMNSSFSSICPRSTRRRNRIQPCASR